MERAAALVADEIRRAGGEAEVSGDAAPPAGPGRGAGRLGRAGRAARGRLRALRRPAPGAHRALDQPAVRAGRPRREPLRARRERRQGQPLHADRGGPAPGRRGRAARAGGLRGGGGGGERRHLGARALRGRRRAGAGGPDLRQPDDRPRPALPLHGRAGDALPARPRAHGRRRRPLRPVRRGGPQRRPRPDGGPRRGGAPGRPPAGAALRRRGPRGRGRGRRLERPAPRRRGAGRRRPAPGRRRRGRRLLHAHARLAVARRPRALLRRAVGRQDDRPGRGVRHPLPAARAAGRTPRPSPRRSTA